ncbi:MAG: ABC transporter permease [Gammaproteobacteria bacterium]|jgi:putative ABC transport system permease protein
MGNLLKIAMRNLIRNWRRTFLTAGLITVGVVAVLLFTALAGSFKELMIGQFTDSVVGDLEIHAKGYVASIDNLPLTLDMSPRMTERAEAVLKSIPDVVADSPRVKFAAMLSNFAETTGVRVNGIDPQKEDATLPLLRSRIVAGDRNALLKPGQILIPDLLANGMHVKVGSTVVLIATNRDGSVNGQTFVVHGILSGLNGPGGKDSYIDINDARHILRMPNGETNEIVVRLKTIGEVPQVVKQLRTALSQDHTTNGKPLFEVHSWDQLTPFSTVARMIDLLTLFIKVILVSIVLISVLNVMVMAVYERIREIGTIAAIGTQPRRIMGLFLVEGLLLGVFGTLIGVALSLGAIFLLNIHKVTFAFGQQSHIVLAPTIGAWDVVAACVVVIVVASLASVQPAWRAARMDPIAALRHI